MGDGETGRRGDGETGRRGDGETVRLRSLSNNFGVEGGSCAVDAPEERLHLRQYFPTNKGLNE